MVALRMEMESTNTIRFQYKEKKQCLLIKAILSCTALSLEDLANLLDVSYGLLQNVFNNKEYLPQEQGLKLAELFIILFTE